MEGSVDGPQLKITVGLVPYGYEMVIINQETGTEQVQAHDFGASYDEIDLVAAVEEALFQAMREVERRFLRGKVKEKEYPNGG